MYGCDIYLLGHVYGIVTNMEGIKELLKYVGRTARFKTTLGDAIGDVSHLEPKEG